jgi:hypothetical protein
MKIVDTVRGEGTGLPSYSSGEEKGPILDRHRRPSTQSERRVGLFFDFEAFRRALARRYHAPADPSALAAKLFELAKSEGRVVYARVYGDWSQQGTAARDLHNQHLDPVLVLGDDAGEGGTTIRMVMDIVESLHRRGPVPDLYIVASTEQEVQPALRKLRESGKEVILASLREAVNHDLARRADRIAWLDDLLALQGEPEGDIDFEMYDWAPFVRLLDSLAANLEFVGLNYVIRRVMDRTNCGYSELRRKQDIINFAQNSGIIEVYQVENKEEGGDPVSACRLHKEHPIVSRVLETLRAYGKEGGAA